MATFGNTSIESTDGFIAVAVASKFTVADGGTITAIQAYVGIWAAQDNMRCAIYADAAGSPGSKLAESSEVIVTAGSQWWSAPLSYAFTAGTYWLAMFAGPNGGLFEAKYRSPGDVANQSAYKTATYPTWPDPFSKDSFLDQVYSIYATYTPTVVDGTLGYLKPNRLRPRIFSPGLPR